MLFRSDTEDTFISDLAVGLRATQLKSKPETRLRLDKKIKKQTYTLQRTEKETRNKSERKE